MGRPVPTAQRERNWHAAIPAAMAGVALISCAVLTNPLAIMVMLTIGLTGVFCYVSVFWAVPSAMLSGSAAAAGLALINALANIGSFFWAIHGGLDKNVYRQFLAGHHAIGLRAVAVGDDRGQPALGPQVRGLVTHSLLRPPTARAWPPPAASPAPCDRRLHGW